MYIFAHLMGGLGNRLFQVAAAYGHARNYGQQFTLVLNEIEEERYSSEKHLDTILRKCPVREKVSDIMSIISHKKNKNHL